MFVLILKKNYDHKCRENWKWVKSGQNKMFCGEGQSIIFTFSNAELLVIEACSCGPVQSIRINSLNTFFKVKGHEVNRYKFIICHMDWL